MQLSPRSFCLPLLLLFSCTYAQRIEEEIKESVSLSFIKSEIEFLAHDDMRGRNTGSAELVKAAEHIATLFEEWNVEKAPGTDSYLQKVPLFSYTPPTSAELMLNGSKSDWEFLFWDSDNLTISGDIIYAGFGQPADYEKLDARGKIVIVRAGTATNPTSSPAIVREKTLLAAENGAAAIIELTAFVPAQWSYYKTSLSKERVIASTDQPSIPYMWLNDPDKTAISQFQSMEGKPAQLKISGSAREQVEAYNVVGYVPGTGSENEAVLLSAHYDHVGVGTATDAGDSIYNGARDNAVGTVAVLAAAKTAAARPPKRSLLFVLFAGEEKGMIGSQYFAENSPVPLDQIVFNLNSDNAGYNDTTRVTVVGLSRTNAADAIVEASKTFGLRALNDPAPEQNLFDRSDNVHFAKKGIPAPTFSMGFTAFDAEIGQYYHQPADAASSLDFNYVLKFTRAYVYSAYLVANMEQRPFWMEGDKYYEQGLQLYRLDSADSTEN